VLCFNQHAGDDTEPNVARLTAFAATDAGKPPEYAIWKGIEMNITITENKRGFLFKNGIYKKMIPPGKHKVRKFLGEDIEVVNATGWVTVSTISPKLLLRDKDFANNVTVIDVPDNHIAIYSIDGRLHGSVTPGQYIAWSIYEKYTFKLIDISQPDASSTPVEYFPLIPAKTYAKIQVEQGECALLYFDGAYQKTLESGCYYFWNKNIKVSFRLVDLRIRQLVIPGQEILTADKVGLRINFVCHYKITDPVKMASDMSNFDVQIYSVVQLALRKHIGAYRLDELLENKSDIADVILGKLRDEQDRLYVEFSDAGIKDIILPGEISSIMNTVLIAEKAAQANVISRREEVASTRSLLNTAKLLDENETLRRMKEMEYLERICDKVGSISVSNGGGLLEQLRELVAPLSSKT